MDIGIGSKAVIAMPQPGLNVLHGIAKVEHNRRTAVTEIMEPYIPQIPRKTNLQKLLLTYCSDNSNNIIPITLILFRRG